MKIKNLLIFSVLLCSFSLTSCKKDDDSNDGGNGGGETAAKYIGTWNCTGITSNGDIILGGNVAVGTFNATGFDLSDFNLTFNESPSSLLRDGDYSLDVNFSSTSLPVSEIDIENQSIFPYGLYSVDEDETTITVELTGGSMQDITILENTDTKLVLSLNQELNFQTPEPIVYDVKLDSDFIFTFEAQ